MILNFHNLETMRNIAFSLIFFTLSLIQASNLNAQIDLLSEHEAGYSNLVLIDDNTPMVISSSDQLSFTLHDLDGTVIDEVDVPSAGVTGDVQILYVTRSLFDCDTTTIMYVINHIDIDVFTQSENRWVKIMQTDGTELFYMDNATLYEGVSDFSVENSKSIVNSSNGAIMKVGLTDDMGSPLPVAHRYYQLCGSLPVLERSANLGELTGIWDGQTGGTQLVLYPNPTNDGFVQFELDEIESDGTIRLFNMNGQLVKEAPINQGETLQYVGVSDLPPGTYVLNIALEDGSIVSEKFVKL